jgi:serine/threonine protein kinase/tetratricopeptide (TPR) repeat protein
MSDDPYRLTGSVLTGRYKLHEVAGIGGLGAVYKAISLKDNRIVAVKIIKPDLVHKNSEYVKSFEREIGIAKSLNHPNIVKIYESGSEENIHFMVMEWLDGVTLQEKIDNARLPIEFITAVFQQIRDAFFIAHSQDIIHLDIKPNNIFILGSDDAPIVKVIDFGMSRIISSESGITATQFGGTQHYCSPEHFGFGGKLTYRSDIYSLGVTLFNMLTGTLPYGTSYIQAIKHPNLERHPIPSILSIRKDLPIELDEVIQKSLNINPVDRQNSVIDLFREFERAINGEPIESLSDIIVSKSKSDSNQLIQSLLEKIADAFYDFPDAKIERNVKLFAESDNENRNIDIDILLTIQVAGQSIRFAFQCKDKTKPIDIDDINSFITALDNIGIPRKNGFFVTNGGFTPDALKTANNEGIKISLLEDLTVEELRRETIVAVQHRVFLIPKWTNFALTNDIAEAEYPAQFLIFSDENQKPVGTFSDLILGKWLNGEIPSVIGEYDLELEVPQGWYQFFKGKKVIPQKIECKVTVLGVVISVLGEVETHQPKEINNESPKESNAKFRFNEFLEGEVIPLNIFSSESDLENFVQNSGYIRVTLRTKLERIIFNNLYYPFTERIVRKMFEQVKQYGDDFSTETQEKVQQELLEVSKNDIFSIGKFGLGGIALPVITVNDDGDLIDLTLHFKRKEYDKIIALRHKYDKNPYKSFGDLLALSYLEKSKILFEKAKEKEGLENKRLIKESLNKIKAALEIDPRMLDAVEQLSNVMFYKEDYPESLRALDYIINREPENAGVLADRAFVLTKINEWAKSLETINKAKHLADAQQAEPNLKGAILLRRAVVYHHQKNYEKAWDDIFEAWKTDPNQVVKNNTFRQIIFDVTAEIRNIEAYWLELEILWYLSAAYRMGNQVPESLRAANEAANMLKGLTRPEDAQGELISIGVLEGDIVEDVLLRSAERLRETGDKDFVNQQIIFIQDWIKTVWDDDGTFLDKYKI